MKRTDWRLIGIFAGVLLLVGPTAGGGATGNRAAPSAVAGTARVDDLFGGFIKGLSAGDLGAGNCVANSTKFYQELERAGLVGEDTRLVLMVREPNRGMPQPMVPDRRFLRGEPSAFWIWHAFVLTGGRVYDANFRQDGAPLAQYFTQFWAKDPNFASFWVFAVRLETLPQLVGSPYPGAAPRMLQFAPITPAELIRNPRHLTRRR